jgi:NAD(P)-dependent dehydrogenase (short-subunit alcohol dehydrogenase family)
MGKLDGKAAVITGATSGMALASARLFVEEGAHVFITGRRQDNLDNAVKAIGRNVTGVQGDSAKLADLDRLYETVRREKGYVDVVFASAGHGGRRAAGGDHRRAVDSIISLNTRGTVFTVQKALPMMRNGGSIIMNGSIAHLKGMPGLGVYAGSKAALRSFARSWAVELAESRIRVNVLSPGPIATNALANAPAEAKEYFLSAIPRKEFGRSEEIATTALFLASDDSSFVNGSEICVDGGLAQI